MKNLFYFMFCGLILLGMSSCGDDLGDDATTGPVIDFTSNPGAGYVTGNTSLDAGSTIRVKVSGTKGSSLLNTLTITSQKSGQSEVNIDISDLVKDGSPASANPLLILDASEQNSFNYTFEWKHTTEMVDVTYAFYLSDKAGRQDVLSFTVSTRGRAVRTITDSILTNSAGPVGTGGINLLTGAQTGSADSLAVLSANGNFPNLDWSQQFRATNPNNTVIRRAASGLDFDALATTIDIENAYNNGTVLTGDITGQLNAVYLVNKNNYIWAVKITNIVLTPPLTMGGDNLDHFVLDIKQ
ncbi:MAG: hypothetical protein IPM48_06050 [Saprospiraceae bacterium]|nr:hypothetical protein [Saprospiraceae bacterium]